jgi:uncharacterized membrane protein
MIPLVGVVSVRRWPRSRSFRLWIPLFLLWLLLLPLTLLFLPVILIVCLVSRVNPFEAIATFWGIFAGFRDTHIEIDNGEALVLIRIL